MLVYRVPFFVALIDAEVGTDDQPLGYCPLAYPIRSLPRLATGFPLRFALGRLLFYGFLQNQQNGINWPTLSAEASPLPGGARCLIDTVSSLPSGNRT